MNSKSMYTNTFTLVSVLVHYLQICCLRFRVIRVWDIVDDHDKLQNRIDLAVERIEKSRLRGEKSAIYSEYSEPDGEGISQDASSGNYIFVPKVFASKQGAQNSNSLKSETSEKNQKRHYPPANPNPLQYTLLKFYQLNSF